MADPTDRQLLVRLLTQVAEVRANQIVTDRVVDILYLSRFDDEQRARAERELRELRRTADEDLAGELAEWVDGPGGALDVLLRMRGIEPSRLPGPPGPHRPSSGPDDG